MKIPLADPDTVVGPTGVPRGDSQPVHTASDTSDQYLEPLYLDMREHHVDPEGQPIANLRAWPLTNPRTSRFTAWSR